MNQRRDPRVDEYIASLPDWQARLAERVRTLVLSADDEVTETIKRTRLPYFVLQGNICALLGARDHLNVFVYDPIAADPTGLINQGHGNATARAIQLREDDVLDEGALVELFRAVIANNRDGGWRQLSGLHRGRATKARNREPSSVQDPDDSDAHASCC